MDAIYILVLLASSLGEQDSLDQHRYYRIPLKRNHRTPEEKKAIFNKLCSDCYSKFSSFLSISSEIELKNYENSEFIGEIGIGTPPQLLDVLFDTGSGNFFINSKLCTQKSCKRRESYDHDKSLTYINQGLPIDINFGIGEIVGVMNQDTLTIAEITIPYQDIAEVKQEIGSVFDDINLCGIMGLGFNKLASPDTIPVFDNIVNSNTLDWNVFSFYFTLDENEESEVLLGDVNPDKFYDPIYWIPLTEDPHYWTVIIQDVRFGDKSLGVCNNDCIAAVDTGTSLISAPTDMVKKMNSLFGNSCVDIDSYPDLIYVINGIEFSLPPTLYILHSSDDVEYCSLAFMSIDVGYGDIRIWTLGDLFLSKYYSIFDRDHMRVGFAEAKHNKVISYF